MFVHGLTQFYITLSNTTLAHSSGLSHKTRSQNEYCSILHLVLVFSVRSHSHSRIVEKSSASIDPVELTHFTTSCSISDTLQQDFIWWEIPPHFVMFHLRHITTGLYLVGDSLTVTWSISDTLQQVFI